LAALNIGTRLAATATGAPVRGLRPGLALAYGKAAKAAKLNPFPLG
jgi:hypothetical protein